MYVESNISFDYDSTRAKTDSDDTKTGTTVTKSEMNHKTYLPEWFSM